MNARRRSVCRRFGVTTATCTAVSSPAADARTARPTSAPAATRIRSASARSGRVGVPVGRGRTNGRHLRSADRLESAQQAHQGTARARLDRRQRPATCGQRLRKGARPGRVAPGPHVRPECGEHGSLSLVGQLHRRTPALRPRGDPDVDRLLPGVRRDHGVDGPKQGLTQQLRDHRFADAGEPQRPDLGLEPDPSAGEPRHDLVRPHRAHLARRSGQRDDHPAVRPIDPPAGRRPVRIRQHRARREDPRLLGVGLRERLATTRPQAAQPLEGRLVDDRRLATGLRHRLAGQVVRAWVRGRRW